MNTMKPRFPIWVMRKIPILSSSLLKGGGRGWVSPTADERGAALILALLVTMVLAVFSMVAVMTATQGLSIAGKYKIEEQAVYSADGGVEFASGLIKDTIGNKNLVSATYLSKVNTTNTTGGTQTDFEREIAGVNGDSASGLNPDTTATPNATVVILGDTANIDIDFTRSKLMPGSSAEAAARYEGIGSGTSGGVMLLYQIDSKTTINQTSKTIRATYKCVEGGGRCL